MPWYDRGIFGSNPTSHTHPTPCHSYRDEAPRGGGAPYRDEPRGGGYRDEPRYGGGGGGGGRPDSRERDRYPPRDDRGRY